MTVLLLELLYPRASRLFSSWRPSVVKSSGVLTSAVLRLSDTVSFLPPLAAFLMGALSSFASTSGRLPPLFDLAPGWTT